MLFVSTLSVTSMHITGSYPIQTIIKDILTSITRD